MARKADNQTSAGRWMWVNILGVVALLGSAGAGLFVLQQRLESRTLRSEAPPTVVLKDRPTWMSDALHARLLEQAQPSEAHSVFDRELLVGIARQMRSSPWVREVRQVRRIYGDGPGDTIEVDCDFRAPVALVKWKDYFWLVDAEGVKLPEQYNDAEVNRVVRSAGGQTNLRIIEGVAQPPVESGKRWPGEDLAAGIELAGALAGHGFADDIVRVNVANFGGRINAREPQITLITRYWTEIRWGRPISARDFFVEVAPARKLEALHRIYQKYGRVDADQPWVDIRFDRITIPGETAQAGT